MKSMSHLKPKLNRFVVTPDEYRIGKLIRIKGSEACVRFRHSTVKTEDRWYPLQVLERGYLTPQMRVFWQEPGTTHWQAGRVTWFSLNSKEDYVD